MLILFKDAAMSGARALAKPLKLTYGVHQELQFECVYGPEHTPIDVESHDCTRWNLVVTKSLATPAEVLLDCTYLDNIFTVNVGTFDFALTSLECYKHMAGAVMAPAVLSLYGYQDGETVPDVTIQLPVAIDSSTTLKMPVAFPTALMQELQLGAAIAGAAVERVERLKLDAQHIVDDASDIARHVDDGVAQARGYAESACGCAVAAEAAQAAAEHAADAADAAKLAAEGYRDQAQAIYEATAMLVRTYTVGPAYNYGVTESGTLLSFTWRDPKDTEVVRWKKTRLIMKQGGFPANETDGTVLVDNLDRDAYSSVPFTWDMGVLSDCYFALFTEASSGAWNTGDDAPRFTTGVLTWATISMMSAAGTLLQYPGMAIGSVIPIQTNDIYPKFRWKLAHVDYSGSFEDIRDFMYGGTRRHNSIWIGDYLPCIGDDNDAATVQFDAPEKAYGATWDTVFITGKAYYTVSGETYTQLVAGTDYQDGSSIAEWQTIHDTTVYTKNTANRVSYGNNIWKESNMMQWLNATGSNWFQRQNPYDVKSGSIAYASGWMSGFEQGFTDLVVPVYNKTARNTLSSLSEGGGGGYDITLNKFWLPSLKEFNGSDVNSIAEGQQFAWFRDVAMTAADRIQRDEGGTACVCWLRSPLAANVSLEYYINTSGSGTYSTVNSSYAFLPVMCL